MIFPLRGDRRKTTITCAALPRSRDDNARPTVRMGPPAVSVDVAYSQDRGRAACRAEVHPRGQAGRRSSCTTTVLGAASTDLTAMQAFFRVIPITIERSAHRATRPARSRLALLIKLEAGSVDLVIARTSCFNQEDQVQGSRAAPSWTRNSGSASGHKETLKEMSNKRGCARAVGNAHSRARIYHGVCPASADMSYHQRSRRRPAIPVQTFRARAERRRAAGMPSGASWRRGGQVIRPAHTACESHRARARSCWPAAAPGRTNRHRGHGKMGLMRDCERLERDGRTGECRQSGSVTTIIETGIDIPNANTALHRERGHYGAVHAAAPDSRPLPVGNLVAPCVCVRLCYRHG